MGRRTEVSERESTTRDSVSNAESTSVTGCGVSCALTRGATVNGCGPPAWGSPKAITCSALTTAGSVAASGVDSASRITTASTACSSPRVAVSTSGLAVHTGTREGVRRWTRSSSSVRARPLRSMSRRVRASRGNRLASRAHRVASSCSSRAGAAAMCAESARRKADSVLRSWEPSGMATKSSPLIMASRTDCHHASSSSSSTCSAGTPRDSRSARNSPRPRARRSSSSTVRSGRVLRWASSLISSSRITWSSSTVAVSSRAAVAEPSKAMARPSRSSRKRRWVRRVSSARSDTAGCSRVVAHCRQRSRSDCTFTSAACRSDRCTPGRMYSLAALRSRERCSPLSSISWSRRQDAEAVAAIRSVTGRS